MRAADDLDQVGDARDAGKLSHREFGQLLLVVPFDLTGQRHPAAGHRDLQGARGQLHIPGQDIQGTLGDLVVSQDIPLAACVVERGGIAVNPRGELYTAENMAERLSMRNFMEELRGSGMQTGGPPSFHARDRQAFANRLDHWIAQRPRR